MYKRRLDQRGLVIPDSVEKHQVGPEQDDKLLHKGNETECGSCYGAGTEDECCNSCDEVGRPRASYSHVQSANQKCERLICQGLSSSRSVARIRCKMLHRKCAFKGVHYFEGDCRAEH